jgi:lauroyl/myristoyl acyltransferase
MTLGLTSRAPLAKLAAMPATAESPASAASPARWGLSGDLPWRMLTAALAACPWYLEGIYNSFWSGLIGLAARKPVGNLAGNLRSLGTPFPAFQAWRAISEFGAVTIDGQRALHGVPLAWEVEGIENVRAAETCGLPVVLWTAHMGSYDAAAAFFARRLPVRLHTVRRPEPNPRLREIREQSLAVLAGDRHATHYNDGPESGLALRLLRALQAGEWVAVQADRALDGLSTFRFEHDGLAWTLPKGPFVLPLAARAACLPVFVNRIGPRRYRVRFFPLEAPGEYPDKETGTRHLAARWTTLLAAAVRENPSHWLAFERLVEPTASHES